MASKERKYVPDRYGREDQPYGYEENGKLTTFTYEGQGKTLGLGKRSAKKFFHPRRVDIKKVKDSIAMTER